MNPRHRSTTGWKRGLAVVTAAASVAAGAGPAHAGGWTVAAGPVGGVLALDPALHDYRWNTGVHPLWGVAGGVSGERLGLGLRVWRSGTTQSTGIPGETFAADVGLTGSEVVGSVRLARLAGVRVRASGSAGALHLGWSPDRVELTPFGGGEAIEVAFEPVTEWITGVGLSAERAVLGGLQLGLGVERSWFRLDTVHRAGSEIVAGRETFGNWTLRAELTHRVLQP